MKTGRIGTGLMLAGLALGLINTTQAAIVTVGDGNWTDGLNVWGAAGTDPGTTTYSGTDDLNIRHNVVVNSAVTGTGGNKLQVVTGTLTYNAGGSVAGFDNTMQIDPTGALVVDGGTAATDNTVLVVDGTVELKSGAINTGGTQLRNSSTVTISDGTFNMGSSLIELGRGTAGSEVATLEVIGSAATISGGSLTLNGRNNTADDGDRVLDFTFDGSGISAIALSGNVIMTMVATGAVSYLNVDVSALTDDGTTAFPLLTYGGSLTGDFESFSIVGAAGALTPGTLGSLGENEYAFDVDASNGSYDIYVNTGSAPPAEIGPVTIEVMGGSNLVFSWEGVVGQTYALQARTNLLEGAWENVVTNIAGAASINITNGDVSAAQSFYQVLAD